MSEEENGLIVPASGSPGAGGCSRTVPEEHGESGEPELEPGMGAEVREHRCQPAGFRSSHSSFTFPYISRTPCK